VDKRRGIDLSEHRRSRSKNCDILAEATMRCIVAPDAAKRGAVRGRISR
jgi:hypothetical protein